MEPEDQYTPPTSLEKHPFAATVGRPSFQSQANHGIDGVRGDSDSQMQEDEFFDYDAYQRVDAASALVGMALSQTPDLGANSRYPEHEQDDSNGQYGTIISEDNHPTQRAIGTRHQASDVEMQDFQSPAGYGATDAQYDQLDDDEDEQEEYEMTPVQAAYHAYHSDNPWYSDLIPFPSTAIEEDTVDPTDGIKLQDVIDLTALDAPEKWDVDPEALRFLASVHELTKSDDAVPNLNLPPSCRDLKLPEPALKTDHHVDMLRLFERNQVRLNTSGVKPVPLNDERDESLKWSKASLALPAKLDDEIAKEKLDVEIGTVEYLHDIFRGPEIDLSTLLERERGGKARPKPVSLPLLPLSPPYSPGGIPSPAAQVDFTSTPEDPTTQEAVELEQRILEKDDIRMQQRAAALTNNHKAILGFGSSPEKRIVQTSSSPTRAKSKRTSDLKVSDPLMPQESSEPPSKKAKTVSFQDEVQTLVPQPDSSTDSMETYAMVNEVMAAVTEIVSPLTQPAISRADGEQLSEADTVLRVPIPEIDDIKPSPPWHIASTKVDGTQPRQKEKFFMNELVVKTLTDHERKWGGSKEHGTMINWSAFPPHLGRPKPEGDFDDGSLARYLAELDLEGDFDMKLLTWKPDGLRLLDVDEFDDDEIEPVEVESEVEQQQSKPIAAAQRSFTTTPTAIAKPASTNGYDSMKQSNSSSLSDVLAKRKKQIEAARNVTSEQPKTKSATTASAQANSSLTEAATAMPERNHLNSFAALQGWPERLKAGPVGQLSFNKPDEAPKKLQAKKQAPIEVMVPPPAATGTIPTPQIPAVSTPPSIILSSTLMSNHKLLRNLTTFLPGLNILERQYMPANREADITVSPSTGILFTTLQKLKQKPLPGSSTSNSTNIRTQIGSIATRYEKLILLISENQSHILDDSDAEILQSLSATSRLQVQYVPANDPEILAKWTASLILRHQQPTNLLPDESFWETFLRKAGLNAFAAQMVISQLKRTRDSRSQNGSGEAHGLSAFVLMSPEERMLHFAELMGGENVLRRVNTILEAGWPSAANLK